VAGVKALLGRWRAPRPRQASIVRHESFLVYRRGYYLKLALALCGLSILAYAIHDPAEGRSGSTWLGYTLGTVGALLIVWLAWFGVRKRQFRESRAPVQAWVSAHVYLGLSLIVVATLHTGFQVGWNVHTLAYVLMLLVIVSGIYGILAYSTLPERITAARNQMEFRAMVEEVRELNEAALSLADKIDPETHATVTRSVSRARIGGSAWEQLSGRYRRLGDPGALDKFFKLKEVQLSTQSQAPTAPAQGRGGRQGTIMFMADQIFSGRGEKGKEPLQKLLQTIAKRNTLLERINRDITLRARLAVWLYVHVPLTVALLAALLAHVLSVFLYW
jgi:hypothetical protein